MPRTQKGRTQGGAPVTTRILVIGDFIQDVYTFGAAVRLCPEAPVPVLIPQIERESLGGAGLVWEQLWELGADTLARFGSKSSKHRYFAGNHLICRVDNDGIGVGWDAPLEPSIEWADAFVIADYGKGAMTRELAEQLVATRKRLFVDAKHHWKWYQGHNTFVFPNEHEAPIAEGLFVQVIKKLGARGCEWGHLKFSATVSEVVDTTGAGDVFLAGFVYAVSLGLRAESCLRFANAIAGESCRHVGTYVVPRAFAQAYLDRLRVSEGSERPTRDSQHDSSSPEHRLSIPLDQPFVASALGISGSLLGDCMSAAIARLNLYGSPQPAQILPRSPSDPTESSDVRIQVDQGNSDESGTKSQLEAQGQNPSATECQCEPERALDLAKIPWPR